MAFVAAAHGLIYLLRLSRGEKFNWRLLTAWLLFVSLTLQLHALSLPEFLRAALHEVSLESEWTNPFWVITESLRSLQTGFSGFAVVLCGLLMLCAGWLSIARKDLDAGLLLILPGLVAGSTMLLLGHNLWPRFFFFSVGFALLIVVEGATVVPSFLIARFKRVKAREALSARAGLALVSLMIITSIFTLPRCYKLPKQDFAGARDYVEKNRLAGDAVVSVGLAGGAYGRYFAQNWLVAETEDELSAIGQHYETVWLVYTIPIQVKAYCPGIWEEVEKDYEIVRIFPGTLGGGEIYVCQKSSTADLSKR
jgi:hypothetical protein